MKKAILMRMFLVVIFVGCSSTASSELTEKEMDSFKNILDEEIELSDFTDLTSEALTSDLSEKFPAVKKVYKFDEMYLFVSKPVGYNGPMTMTVAIDSVKGETIGVEIIEHVETEHYVRDFQSAWFTDRFIGKSIDEYLNFVHLEAKEDNEVVIITGATTTTEGAVLGVNACIGLYNEFFLENEMPSVKLEAIVIN